MTQKRRLFVYAAANRLGYRVPEEAPPKTEKKARARAMRGIRTFYQAIGRGRAPKPDGRSGTRNWWYEETLVAHMAKEETKVSKRGRKSIAETEVADANAA